MRASARLILNLFSLMIDSAIPDIKMEGDKSVLYVLDKMRLDIPDAEAEIAFQLLINESTSALFPQVIESVHRWAQYWRR